jgi:hypothetical protein
MLCNGEQRGFSEMVRFAHHDMGFHGRAWRTQWGSMARCATPKRHVMLTGRRHLAAGQRSCASQRTFIVILPPSAQLRACSGRQRAAQHRLLPGRRWHGPNLGATLERDNCADSRHRSRRLPP